MDAITKLIEMAREERRAIWHKLSYRSETHKPTMDETLKWVERLKELNAIIEFLKEHSK